MKNAPHTQRLAVSLGGAPVGQLVQNPGAPAFFVYDADWLSHGFSLTKKHLQFNAQAQTPGQPERDFWGLFGVFNDSLPDGWGLLLMDRALASQYGWHSSSISGLDRLAYMGSRAMGALEYAPVLPQESTVSLLDIAQLARAADMLMAGK